MGENLKLSTAACGLQFLSWAFCLILRLRSQITGFSFRVTAFSFRIRAYSFRIRGFSFRIRVLVSEPGVFSFRIFLVSESGVFSFRIRCFSFRTRGFSFRIRGFSFRTRAPPPRSKKKTIMFLSWMFLSPPIRWGLLDFIWVHRCLRLLLLLLLRPPLVFATAICAECSATTGHQSRKAMPSVRYRTQPRWAALSVRYRTPTAIFRAQCSLADPNHRSPQDRNHFEKTLGVRDIG